MEIPLTLQELCASIDSTNLDVAVQKETLKKLCEDSIRYEFKTVAVNHVSIPYCKEILRGSKVGIDTGVSYPLGQDPLEEKLWETAYVIKLGATEIDYVINIAELKAGNYQYMKEEMKEILKVCKENGAICKVILETYYLTVEEIKAMCEIAAEVKPDFVKTSTGQIKGGGATIEHVRLIKKTLGDSGVGTKAAGGIRTLDDVLNMMRAGATRIGTSSAVSIVEEYIQRFHHR